MIRIEIEKNKWEEIKKTHKEYIYSKIKPKIEIIIKHELLEITNEEKELLEFIVKKIDYLFIEDFKVNDKLFKELYKKKYSIKKLKDRDYDNKIYDDFSSISNRNKSFYENLIQIYEISNSYKDLKNEDLYKIVRKYKYSIKKPNKEELEMNLMEFIFNYDDFSDKSKEHINGWGRHSLLTMMGIEVCPYCQRNYITNYKDEEAKELTTADLDHFYPQAQYPYLALSLYNFIPSCHTCNSTMKGKDEIGLETHIYPYTDSMEEDIKFTIETDSFMDNVFTKNQNLNIGIDVNIVSKEGKKDTNRPNKIENSLETFKLREVYKNSHSKYVGDLIHNFQKYPKSYTKALGEIFLEEEDIDKDSKEHQEKLQILNDNFQEIIKKPYTDKIEKGEPLAKLTKDIMEELGIK